MKIYLTILALLSLLLPLGHGETPDVNRGNRVISICQHSMLGTTVPADFRAHAAAVSMVHPMWFEMTNEGDVKALPGCEGPYGDYVAFCRERGVALLPILRNFKPDALLANEAAIAKGVSQALALVEREALDGLMVDFEGLGAASREPLVSLVRQLREPLLKQGKRLVVAVPPRTWEKEFDYAALAAASDLLFVMFYDYVGPWKMVLGPTAPLDWPTNSRDIRRDLAWLTQLVPADRLIFGIPFYGNEFTLDAEGKATAVTAQPLFRLDALRKSTGAERQWDSDTQTPWFEYTAKDGSTRRVTYEDAQSFAAKLAFADDAGMAGVGAWAFRSADGETAADFWPLLQDQPRQP